MEEQTDKVFIKNFSVVLVLLTVFTIVIIFIARHAGFKEPEPIPSKTTAINERLKPVSNVYMGAAGAAAREAAAAAANKEPVVAFDGSLDGKMIYTTVCAACHATGVLGAPVPGSPEMALRAQAGPETMFDFAVNGLNSMPPRGGRADLSDEQIHAVLDYMVK